MATIAQIKKRIEKVEQRRSPPDIPPFHIIRPGKQPQAEIDAIRAEVADYEQRNPDGPPAFIIELTRYSHDD